MQELKNDEVQASYKVYVEVGVIYEPSGAMVPKYLRLSPTGERYEIERIFRVQRAASRKVGGCGICYSVRIRGKNARLFYEDMQDACRWFVESRYPVQDDDGEVC